MIGAAVIVFREVLEAALVLSVVAAATKAVAGRNRWLAIGISAGALGAIVIALFAGQIAESLEGVGQEIFNATVLLLAVAMLVWHNVWMQHHGRELAARMNAVGTAVTQGVRPLYAVAVAVGLAILREGSELVLFLFGIASGGASAIDLALGGAIGLALGAIAGITLYAGLLKLSPRHLFKATSWLILLLAAGMAATSAKFLVQADILPAWGNMIWDTSMILSEEGIPGQILHVLVGYIARPSGMQIAFYLGTIFMTVFSMFLTRQRHHSLPASVSIAAALIASLGIISATTRNAEAGYKVYTPYVEYHELEIEYRPSLNVDSDGARNNGQVQLLGLGYGVNEWWFTEIYAEWERPSGPGQETSFEAFEWENRFQLSSPGELWADFGLLAEFSRPDAGSSPDKFELALLVAKSMGKFDMTLNLIAERELGTNASDDVIVGQAFQLKYRHDSMLEPGIELYSEFGPVDDIQGFEHQQHYAGPILTGALPLDDKGTKLKYNVGYLFGLTDESNDGVVKAVLELEFPL